LLMVIGATLMLLEVFATPLGIPSDFKSIPLLLGVIFIYFGFRANQKPKA
jgi:hypothetical protein